MTVKKIIIGTLLLHISAFLWGTAFIPQKILVSANIPPFYTVFLRFLPITLGMFFFTRSSYCKISKTSLFHGFFLGVLLFVGFFTQTYGLKEIDASVSAFITSISIILIPLFNFFLFRSKINIYNILAIFSAIIGIYIFNRVSSSETFWNPSIIITFVGSLAFTIHIILTNFYLEKGESPLSLHIVQCFYTAIFSLIFGIIFEEFPTTQWNTVNIISIVYLGIFASIISYGLLSYGQHLTRNPLKAGIIISLEPAWAFLLAIPILGESLTYGKIIGIIFISLGIVFCEWETLYHLYKQKFLKMRNMHDKKI